MYLYLLLVALHLVAVEADHSNHHEYCGVANVSEISIPITTEYVVDWKDDVITPPCTLVFLGKVTEQCEGLCYQFHPNSFIKESSVILTISFSNNTEMFDMDRAIPLPPRCSNISNMTLTIDLEGMYEVKKKEPGFLISLEVYNRCGPRGSIRNVKFEEVVAFIKGYHKPDEFESRQQSTYIVGIVVGFSLAALFLILLLVIWFYMRRNPYVGRNRFMSNIDQHNLVDHEQVDSPEKSKTSPGKLEILTEDAAKSTELPPVPETNGNRPDHKDADDVNGHPTPGQNDVNNQRTSTDF